MNVSCGAVKAFKLCVLFWVLYISSTTRIGARNVSQWRDQFQYLSISQETFASVTLVIAHPDDEVMFFSPTLLQLDQLLPQHVDFNFVCLSKGDADHLGSTRERELERSINLLMANAKREFQLLQFDYPDGFNETWDVASIASTMGTKVLGDDRKSLLLTFDEHGVSNHPNHIACHWAVAQLAAGNKHGAMFLTTHGRNFILKYSAFVWELFKMYTRGIFERGGHNDKISFFSTFPQYTLAFASMANAHQSQLVWFRYGWWLFSRYVFVNDLELVIPRK